MEKASGELRQLQLFELDVLTYLIKTFDKYHLKYYVTGGTVIGIKFFKGFIPYDDDIDIAMPRTDYSKLLKIIQKGIESDYIFRHWSLDEKFKYSIIRVENPNIVVSEVSNPLKGESFPSVDIAPLDGAPVGKMQRNIYYKKLDLYRALLSWYYFDSINMYKTRSARDRFLVSVMRRTGKIARVVVNPMRLKKNMDRLMARQNDKGSKLLGTYLGAYRKKEMLPADIWGKGKLYHFENLQVIGPEKIDEYIHDLYGTFKIYSDSEIQSSRHYSIKKKV